MTADRQGSRNAYMYGNTAAELESAISRPATNAPLRECEGKRKEEKRSRISFGYILFLTAALVALGISLISYLRLQAEITEMSNDISAYETTLNNLTLANDDEYSKMVNAVDYDYIRKVAIEELGMTYATEDQIVAYERENSDYVRQVNDMEE